MTVAFRHLRAQLAQALGNLATLNGHVVMHCSHGGDCPEAKRIATFLGAAHYAGQWRDGASQEDGRNMSPLFGMSPICVGCPTCGAPSGWACHGPSGPGGNTGTVPTHSERLDAYVHAYPELAAEHPHTKIARALSAAASCLDGYGTVQPKDLAAALRAAASVLKGFM